MSDTLGTDAGNLTGQGGSVTNTAGDALLGTDNDGEKSYALGPSLSRAIETGVINGDFGTPPPELDTNIDNAENALPYFSVEVSHTDATAPYVQAVEDTTVASGQVLRFTIPSGAAVGRYARIVRYVAVPGSAARTFTNQPRAAWRNATGTTKTQAIVTIRSQYYESDNTTTTGTEGSNSATFTTIAASTYAYETQANPEGTGAIPTNGAYLRVEVGVQVSVETTSEMTVDLTEVRIDRGNIQYLVTDQSQPELYGPAAVYLFNSTLFLSNGGIVGSEPRITLSANSGDISLTATGQGDAIALTSATRAASTVTIVTTRAHGLATGYEVIVAGITGAAGATMNGTIHPITVTDSTTFTYTSAGTAGTGTVTSATVKSGPGSGIIYLKPAATTTGRVQVDGKLQGDGVTTDLVHGVNLQRTTTLTINTSTNASATAITWSSAVKNTSLYAYWSSGSTIAIPLTGWYNITCHLIFASGTGYAARLYALIDGTVIAESEMQAAANTTSDTVGLATIAYLTAGDSLVFRASASSASKTIGGSARNRCSVVYIGDMSS
jgi:hypothetical protein